MPKINNYAGFWKRATALSVDGMIIMVINAALLLLVTKPSELDPLMLLLEINTSAWTYLAQAIYYGFFLSTASQATPGKSMFSIYVVNQNGSRLSFLKGAARGTLGYFISTMTMSIGFLIAAYRPDKTSLHDMIFRTYVLEGEPQDKFANALKNNSKYKEIYDKPVTEVKPKTSNNLDFEMFIAEEEAKLKIALKVKEQIKPTEEAKAKPVAAKPKERKDDIW